MATQSLSQSLRSIEEKVIDYLQDCHAMEQHVLRLLDSMIATTHDPEILRELKRHHMDTRRHERMVRERLEALGHSPSTFIEVPAVVSAWLKGIGDKVRADKPGKNARDGYITEHAEIAAYSLLEELAERAGDNETARMASFIREDEEQMAEFIASNWGKFIDLTLEENGIEAVRPGGMPRDRGGRRQLGGRRGGGRFSRNRSNYGAGSLGRAMTSGSFSSMARSGSLWTNLIFAAGLSLGGLLLWQTLQSRK